LDALKEIWLSLSSLNVPHSLILERANAACRFSHHSQNL